MYWYKKRKNHFYMILFQTVFIPYDWISFGMNFKISSSHIDFYFFAVFTLLPLHSRTFGAIGEYSLRQTHFILITYNAMLSKPLHFLWFLSLLYFTNIFFYSLWIRENISFIDSYNWTHRKKVATHVAVHKTIVAQSPRIKRQIPILR